MSLENVWFTTDQHRINFSKLIKRFNVRENPEYASACYIVSHPEIFRIVDWNSVDSPIGWYFGQWVGDDDGHYTESEKVSQLSSSYQGLVRACVELYTGRKHYFDLIQWLGNAGDEVYKCFIQALEIRRNRYLIAFKNN